MNSKRAIAQLLGHLNRLGVTHLPRVTPPAAQPADKKTSPARPGTRPGAARPGTPQRPGASATATERPQGLADKAASMAAPMLQSASSELKPLIAGDVAEVLSQNFPDRASRESALCQVAGIVAKCQRCQELASTRKQTVFGVGNPEARIMFIGEAPGGDEDAQGIPFVGAAGQLLDKIIQASKLRREDLYICNILRCRPPGNRNPLPQEAANCREYLDAQIHIVKPEYIVCWGTVAAQNLLNSKQAVGKLRGVFHDYRGIRVMCTYHPSYLLRVESAKKLVWDDMKFFMAELGVKL